MKVKIKVKHLIIIPILIFIVFPNILYFIGKTMFVMDRDIFENGMSTRTYSYGVLDLYTKWPKVLSPFEGEAYFNMGRTKYDYNIGFLSNGEESIIGMKVQLGKYEDAINLHKRGLENSDGTDYSLNAVALFNLYMEKGEVEKAKEIIKISLENESWKKNSAGKLLEIQLAIMENDKKKGEELYRKYYTNTRNGRIEECLGLEKDYYRIDKKLLGDDFYFFDESKLLNNLADGINIPSVNKLVKFRENDENILLKGNVTIKGKLTIDGEPLKYVPIIIGSVNFSEYTHVFNYGQIAGEIVYTDENGNYEIKGMPELENVNVSPLLSADLGQKYVAENKKLKNTKNNKVYELNLGYKKRLEINVDKDLKLEGNSFDINFEKVEGAEYYYTTLMFIDKENGIHEIIKTVDNKVTVPLINGSFAPFKTWIKKEYLVDTRDEADIIGGGEPKMGMVDVVCPSFGGRYDKDNIDFIEVKAIKIVNGKEVIINSNKIKTNIESKEGQINEGIKLLDKGKLKEGEEWLRGKIKEEGYKAEYIYPLIRLSIEDYPFDWKGEIKEFYTKERLDRAKKAEDILLKELYKINENKDEISYFKGEYENFYRMYENEG